MATLVVIAVCLNAVTNSPDRSGRHYAITDLPTLRAQSGEGADRELLLKLFEQTSTTWRMLVDVRFKLLALVPAVSFVALGFVLRAGESGALPALSRLGFAMLGLVATLGLFVYDLRNSQLHDDLISRGRRIEDELGVDTGVFRGRKKAGCIVSHGTATRLVYGAALLAWLLGIVVALIALSG